MSPTCFRYQKFSTSKRHGKKQTSRQALTADTHIKISPTIFSEVALAEISTCLHTPPAHVCTHTLRTRLHTHPEYVCTHTQHTFAHTPSAVLTTTGSSWCRLLRRRRWSPTLWRQWGMTSSHKAITKTKKQWHWS